jgi:hypothetical protein
LCGCRTDHPGANSGRKTGSIRAALHSLTCHSPIAPPIGAPRSVGCSLPLLQRRSLASNCLGRGTLSGDEGLPGALCGCMHFDSPMADSSRCSTLLSRYRDRFNRRSNCSALRLASGLRGRQEHPDGSLWQLPNPIHAALHHPTHRHIDALTPLLPLSPHAGAKTADKLPLSPVAAAVGSMTRPLGSYLFVPLFGGCISVMARHGPRSAPLRQSGVRLWCSCSQLQEPSSGKLLDEASVFSRQRVSSSVQFSCRLMPVATLLFLDRPEHQPIP